MKKRQEHPDSESEDEEENMEEAKPGAVVDNPFNLWLNKVGSDVEKGEHRYKKIVDLMINDEVYFNESDGTIMVCLFLNFMYFCFFDFLKL
jgi:hypothetical protein